jgi:hypothetical protein
MALADVEVLAESADGDDAQRSAENTGDGNPESRHDVVTGEYVVQSQFLYWLVRTVHEDTLEWRLDDPNRLYTTSKID